MDIRIVAATNADIERRYLDDLLRRNRGDTAAAAAEARIPRGTVYRLAKKHGLRPDDYRQS